MGVVLPVKPPHSVGVTGLHVSQAGGGGDGGASLRQKHTRRRERLFAELLQSKRVAVEEVWAQCPGRNCGMFVPEPFVQYSALVDSPNAVISARSSAEVSTSWLWSRSPSDVHLSPISRQCTSHDVKPGATDHGMCPQNWAMSQRRQRAKPLSPPCSPLARLSVPRWRRATLLNFQKRGAYRHTRAHGAHTAHTAHIAHVQH